MNDQKNENPLTPEAIDRDPAWQLFAQMPAPRTNEPLRQRIMHGIEMELHKSQPPRHSLGHYIRFATGYGLATAALILLGIGVLLKWSEPPSGSTHDRTLVSIEVDPLDQELERLLEDLNDSQLSWYQNDLETIQWNEMADGLEEGDV